MTPQLPCPQTVSEPVLGLLLSDSHYGVSRLDGERLFMPASMNRSVLDILCEFLEALQVFCLPPLDNGTRLGDSLDATNLNQEDQIKQSFW